MTRARLALEDGSVWHGQAFGAAGETDGEVCFNTSMTGYQEILTDPSYRGQILVMTYPEMGNYGVNNEDWESRRPQLAGFVVREVSRRVSNFRADEPLPEFLARHGVIGISGVDTRALVRRIRSQGALRGIISTAEVSDDELVERARRSPGLVGRDLVREVMPNTTTEWHEPLSNWAHLAGSPRQAPPADRHVVAIDYGMKANIARHLLELCQRVTIVPGNATAAEILALNPDGVFLSNGPGDPEPLDYAITTIRDLLGKTPVFGICLGHQLLSLACGAKTFKLKFGHRGANQPVQDLRRGTVEITSQNHGFAVDEASLPQKLEITHRNLNDGTIEGVRHTSLPAFAVQYHPESSAGPHDSRYLFREFLDLMAAGARA